MVRFALFVEIALPNANLSEQQFYCYLETLVYIVDAVAIPTFLLYRRIFSAVSLVSAFFKAENF